MVLEVAAGIILGVIGLILIFILLAFTWPILVGLVVGLIGGGIVVFGLNYLGVPDDTSLIWGGVVLLFCTIGIASSLYEAMNESR